MNEKKVQESKSRANRTLLGCIIMVCAVMGTFSVLTNYFGSLCESLNASVTQVSVMFSIASLVSAAVGLAASAFIDKVQARLIVLIGTICFASFFLLLIFGNSLVTLYIAGVFYGFAFVFLGYTMTQSLITWWHAKNTGTKISLVSVIRALFIMVLSPVIIKLLELFGFQLTLAIHGGVLTALLLVATFLLISNKPESYGLEPYGYEETAKEEGGAKAASAEWGLTQAQALKTYSFWAIFFGVGLMMIGVTGFTSNASLIYQSFGYDAMGAGLMLSLYSGFSILWVFLYGVVSDKKGARFATLLFCGVLVIVLFASAIIGGQVGAIILAVMFGVNTFGGMLGAVAYRSLFGTKSIGSLIALSLVASGLGSTFASPIASAIFQATGSYTMYLYICGACVALVFILFFTATSKKNYEKYARMANEDARA